MLSLGPPPFILLKVIMDRADLYENVVLDSTSRIKSAILEELSSPDFDWDQLISLLIEEGSPLQEVFSSTTLQLGLLYSQAQDIMTLVNDMTGENLQHLVLEDVDVPLDEASEKPEAQEDDFADFEGM